MLFETDITVLTTHTPTAKLQTTIKLSRGILHHVGVYFPPGCQGVVHVAINRGIHQFFPVTPGTSTKGDTLEIGGAQFQPILSSPYEVDVWGWSESASYDHKITVRLWVMQIWQMMPFSDQMYQLALADELKLTL